MSNLDKLEVIKLEIKKDDRGWLTEILRGEKITKPFGQIFLSVAKPNITKGNHYHKRKTEWFCVIKGKANLILKDIDTNETKEIPLNEEEPTLVLIPPKVSHKIINLGETDLYLLAYVDETFNKEDPDTFSLE